MSSLKPVKLIALDVDGTLLNSKSELTPRSEAVLRAALERGIQLVLATGKTRNSTQHLVEKLQLKAYGIYLQGLVTYDPEGSVMHEQTLETALIRRVITFADDRGFDILAYSGKRILCRAHTKVVEDATLPYHEPLPEAVGPLHNIIDTVPIHKIMIVGTPRAITALRWQLNLQLGGSARLMQAGLANMLEILPPNASKGAALKMLLKDLKIASEHIMAIGDAENDIEMLKAAEISVAMGNAAQSVKNAAKHVTGTNDEDGAAQAIELYALNSVPAKAETALPNGPSADSVTSEQSAKKEESA